jgi:hypothetical protein
MKKLSLNVEKSSVWMLFVIAVLPLLAATLMYFKLISVVNFIPAFLTIFASGFVANEIAKRLGSHVRKHPWGLLGLATALVAFVGAVLTLLGVNFALFTTIQGFVTAFLTLFAIVEGFK